MITAYFLSFMVWLLGVFFSWLPAVNALPLGIDSYLVAGVSGVRWIAVFFPPFSILINGLMWVIGWKLLLIVVRVLPIIGRAFMHSR